ncbi:MAG: hypothetical protein UF228_00395 [Lachnospiraceae bacterium]|nr:hypothetical protein [Lachnospiraceae bacterium]
MGFFKWLKSKTVKEEIIFEGENLYEKIKSESIEDVGKMYEPLDKEIIEQAIVEDRVSNTFEQKKTSVEHICEQMVICEQRIESAKKEYEAVNGYINDIIAIENMEEPIKGNVEYYARRIITLREDKKSLKEHSTKIPESKYMYMQRHEDEIQDILKEMYEDEQESQRLKTDMHHIEGEKVALKQEKKEAIEKMGILKSLSKIGAITAIIMLGILIWAQFNTKEDYIIWIYVVVIITLIGGIVLMLKHQEAVRTLKLTERKLNKAIGLMNKYKLLYVNVQSRIEYKYEAHGVKSSHELNDLWRLFINAKKEHEAFHLNSDNTFKSVEGLITELDKLKLYDSSVWPSQVDAIVDGREMAQIRQTLNVRRQKLKQSISFNTNTLENCKKRIETLIEKNPVIAKDIIAILDKYESRI